MTAESKSSTWPLYTRLLSYVGDKKYGLWIAISAMIAFAVVDTAFVYSVKPLIDDGITGKDPNVLRWMPIIVMVIILLRGLFSFIANYCMAWVGNHVVMRLQSDVFARLTRLPITFFESRSTGTIVSKMTYDATQVAQAASSALIAVFREGATVIGLLGLMFYHSWQLSTIFLVIGPCVGLCIALISRRYRKVSHQLQDAMGNVTTATEQAIQGHREVLMFRAADFEQRRFDQVANFVRQQRMKMAAADAMSNPVIQVVASSALAVLLYIASFEQVRQTLTPGTFTVVITAMMMLLRPLKSLTQVNAELQRGLAACSSLFALIDTPIEADTGQSTGMRVSGRLAFENVTFFYPKQTQPALFDVSFEVKAGKTVALVGRSGSGKSTLVSLLARFYQPYSGQILLDDIPISDLSLHDLRGQFAWVSQHVHLFNDTVKANIAYAGDYSDVQIIKAAKMAFADEFIEHLENGYDTLLGENGTILSGGQRQRIAVARAFLVGAPILLLDEATSALDNESERKIQNAIDAVRQNCTVIVIAHRLSTIENADEILVIDEGLIVERGSHEALLAQRGHYAKLHARELKKAS